LLSSLISLLVLINPFALFVYLKPVMDDLSLRDFNKVLVKASLTSLLIFMFFSEFGMTLFRFLSIDFESFRIFGGIVIFSMALIFIIQGKKSFITLRGNLDELASEIALPFMVGAGSISICVVIGNRYPVPDSIFLIMIAMLANFIVIISLTLIKYKIISERFKIAFDKFMVYFLRVNGFIAGAIGINMALDGIRNLFFK